MGRVELDQLEHVHGREGLGRGRRLNALRPHVRQQFLVLVSSCAHGATKLADHLLRVPRGRKVSFARDLRQGVRSRTRV
eukprot:687961-Rhodomonas_salina.1